MNRGIVGALRQNKKGVWFTDIEDEGTGEQYHYSLRPEDQKTITEGSWVKFNITSGQEGAGKAAACHVSLIEKGDFTKSKHPIGNPSDENQTNEVTGAAYYLPKDTADLLFLPSKVAIDNSALEIQKYLQIFKEKIKVLKIQKEQKFSTKVQSLLSEIRGNQLEVLAAYKHNYCITGELGSRMVVGLGGSSVFETAITLHHTYGFPYIPGSTVKGCLRSLIIREVFGGNEENALSNEKFAEWFGTKKQRGSIFFLDVFPVKCNKLELDIMNPHYTDYYNAKAAPTDDQKLIPIKFYAVPTNTQFVFRFVSRKLNIKDETISNGKSKPIEFIDLLKTMLSEIGVGAKTAVGYGWFTKLEDMKQK